MRLDITTLATKWTSLTNHGPLNEWVRWFAWRPVLTEDHRVIWWEWIERRYEGSFAGVIPLDGVEVRHSYRLPVRSMAAPHKMLRSTRN